MSYESSPRALRPATPCMTPSQEDAHAQRPVRKHRSYHRLFRACRALAQRGLSLCAAFADAEARGVTPARSRQK